MFILSLHISSYLKVKIRSQRRSFVARDSRISSAIKGSDNFHSEMISSFRIFSISLTNLLYLSQSTTNIRKIYHLRTFQHGIVSTIICLQKMEYICSGSGNLNALDEGDGSSNASVQSRSENDKKEEKKEEKKGEGNESWSLSFHHFITFIPPFSQRTLCLFRHW